MSLTKLYTNRPYLANNELITPSRSLKKGILYILVSFLLHTIISDLQFCNYEGQNPDCETNPDPSGPSDYRVRRHMPGVDTITTESTQLILFEVAIVKVVGRTF